ncbi:MAG TPA: hypothetical protein VK601_06720, partial [Kofleriaceae bacterium]|nr:hypothetical protein [Kofleriaceae bacterium]
PGKLTVSDSCFGSLPVRDFSSFTALWTIPDTAPSSCTTTVHATTLEGSSAERAGTYTVF